IYEGDTSPVNASLTVVLSEVSAATVTVDYVVSDGTATTADDDYDPQSGTIAIPPGDTMGGGSLFWTNADVKDEDDEYVTFTLSNPGPATLVGSRTATITILNAAAPPTAAFGSSSHAGAAAAVSATLSVVLSEASATTVTVDYATGDGTATAGSDY